MKNYDRAAVMREAHKQWRQSKRLELGWDFARCLRFAWHKAKGKKEIEDGRMGRSQHQRGAGSNGRATRRSAGGNSSVGAFL